MQGTYIFSCNPWIQWVHCEIVEVTVRTLGAYWFDLISILWTLVAYPIYFQILRTSELFNSTEYSTNVSDKLNIKKTPVISVRMLSKLKKEKSDKRIAFFKYSFLKSLWPFICNNFCINNFIQVSQHVHCPVMHSVLFNHVPCYHTRCTMSIHTTLHVYNQCWMSFI